MLRLSLLVCSSLALTACSHFHTSSNLDKSNFADYFQPSMVRVYQKSELLTLDYDVIGAVEGSSCQENKNDRPADIREARTNARINAAELGANAINLQSCITFAADNACISNIICYGRALSINVADKE